MRTLAMGLICGILAAGATSAQSIPAEPDTVLLTRPPTTLGLVAKELGAGYLLGYLGAASGVLLGVVAYRDEGLDGLGEVVILALAGYGLGASYGVHWVAAGGHNITASYPAAVVGLMGGAAVSYLVGTLAVDLGEKAEEYTYPLLGLFPLIGAIWLSNRSRRYLEPVREVATLEVGGRAARLSLPQVFVSPHAVHVGLRLQF